MRLLEKTHLNGGLPAIASVDIIGLRAVFLLLTDILGALAQWVAILLAITGLDRGGLILGGGGDG